MEYIKNYKKKSNDTTKYVLKKELKISHILKLG
jgi:hypothetical protein